jgi:hypothetical protein
VFSPLLSMTAIAAIATVAETVALPSQSQVRFARFAVVRRSVSVTRVGIGSSCAIFKRSPRRTASPARS